MTGVFYFSKGLQAVALAIVLIDFMSRFPELMSMPVLGVGIALFVLGWGLERYVVRR